MKTELPRRRNFFLKNIGRITLWIMGWKVQGDFPKTPKAVLIAAPHTSNWDFVIGLAAKFYLELEAHWLGKHTLFRKPFRRILRWLGGMPVERGESRGIVQQIVESIQQNEQFLLALSPEGTRKRVERWKTGFYQIAKAAEIPIIPVAFDFGTKTIQIGEAIRPSESLELDFLRLQEFYAKASGKHPDKFNKEIISKSEIANLK